MIWLGSLVTVVLGVSCVGCFGTESWSQLHQLVVHPWWDSFLVPPFRGQEEFFRGGGKDQSVTASQRSTSLLYDRAMTDCPSDSDQVTSTTTTLGPAVAPNLVGDFW